MTAEHKPLVMIIDDAIGNIEVLAAALGDRYEVSFACSAGEGLEIIGRYPPELILLDIMMPGMDGFEACRLVKANPAWRDIPIIFISALEEVADKVNAFKVGGSDYITKPFQPDEVLARVATHVELYRNRRELREQEESLRLRLVELEAANRRLLEMGSQLAQAEKQAAIGQLAAGVAHEINNPLGFISSNLGTLQDYASRLLALVDAYVAAEPELPATVGQNLAARRAAADLPFLREDIGALIDESKTGAERVRVIVRNLLEFSHGIGQAMEAADLHALLKTALAAVWQELKPTLQVQDHVGPLPPVMCMPLQIGQAFTNLLRNAVQAMPKGGQLTLASEYDQDWISIAICDNGGGIAAENLGKIFDPFFTTRPVGQGTGLGLSVAYGILAQHGGRIEVTSTPGNGATFTLRLPLHPPLHQVAGTQ